MRTPKIITEIARDCFVGVETLERQNSDSLDFHEVAVWEIKSALLAVYGAGAGKIGVENE